MMRPNQKSFRPSDEYVMCDGASPCDECGESRLIFLTKYAWGRDHRSHAPRVSDVMKVVCYNTECVFEGYETSDGDRINETVVIA